MSMINRTFGSQLFIYVRVHLQVLHGLPTYPGLLRAFQGQGPGGAEDERQAASSRHHGPPCRHRHG